MAAYHYGISRSHPSRRDACILGAKALWPCLEQINFLWTYFHDDGGQLHVASVGYFSWLYGESTQGLALYTPFWLAFLVCSVYFTCSNGSMISIPFNSPSCLWWYCRHYIGRSPSSMFAKSDAPKTKRRTNEAEETKNGGWVRRV